MAPLVPEIISNEFNFIIALLVGIGFGFALEQAGFSATKKMVGLFYGYDFTVLKVFFTAGVTAMLGVVVLGHIGYLNLDMIYVNPTFLPSALVGGFIMGIGFIVGGFCPGTSVCAAAIGKLDGMAFIVGSILGIFAFMEFYPMLKGLYTAQAMGPILIFDQLGISRNAFALILTLIAIGAFYGITLIENKVNDRKTIYPKKLVTKYVAAGAIAMGLIAFVFTTPNSEERITQKIEAAKAAGKCEFRLIEADKLASEMSQNHYDFYLLDVRSPEEYKKSHIPLAINVPLDSIRHLEYKHYFTQKHRKVVFYANDFETPREACLITKFIGKSENYVLKQSEKEFNTLFHLESDNRYADADESKEIIRFRHNAARKLHNLEEALKHQSAPVKKKAAKVQGGCS